MTRSKAAVLGSMVAGALALVIVRSEAGDASAALVHAAFAGDHGAGAALREQGPGGLARLFALHGPEIAASRNAPTPDAAQQALLDTVDAIAGQRHAAWSGLYWYTDLGQARAAAQATGRPILSLHLLGRLDEELSCANSRFFRVLLYANQDVATALRTRFVLHWQSERPAPRLTVDFGDGRTLVRTVTGNSIHYVLDEGGRVIDALPGLYAPDAFLAALGAAEQAAMQTAQQPPAAREGLLRSYHARAARRLAEQAASGGVGTGEPAGTGGPVALSADRAAMTKSLVERPLVKALTPSSLPARSDLDGWSRLAARHPVNVRLDASTRALIRRGLAAGSEARVLAALARSVALDSVRNELSLHARIHAWLAEPNAREVSPLNERVYAELFLTPASDPWLGLRPDDAYAALEGDSPARRP